jgi:hypothetical protein
MTCDESVQAGQSKKSDLSHWWGLANRAYFDSTPSEIHAAKTEVLFPMFTDAFQYMSKSGRHFGWNIDAGHEFPIVGYQSNTQTRPDGVAQKSWGIGLWFPLSFHMIEDLGKEPSNPILDTDYRFSGMVKAQYGLPHQWGPFIDSHIGVRFQFGHESTHIGDEFTIAATHLFGDLFKRVNVSYEYWDIGFSFEPNFGKNGRQRFKLRAGNIGLFNPSKGWYTPELEHPFGVVIPGSRRNIEPYIDVEYYRKLGDRALGIIVSADIRDRTVYNYEKLSRDQLEDTQVSTNLIAGLKHERQATGALGKIQPTYYLRYYYGVNPAGQFRNQRDYRLFGFGVHFDF